MYQNIIYEKRNKIAILTLNRPASLNAMDSLTMDEVCDAVRSFKNDPEALALVITGAGDRAFAAGADINEMNGLSGGNEMMQYLQRGQGMVNLIENIGKPTIAAINGYALGGGCELALCCTFRMASQSARIGLPEIKLGSIPGMGGTQRLPRIVGKQKAIEMMLTARWIDADEALRVGLVRSVHPDKETLLAAAEEFAQTLAEKAPIAVRYTLEAVNRGMEMPLAEALVFETSLVSLLFESEDMKEGIKAFREKRPAEFKGK